MGLFVVLAALRTLGHLLASFGTMELYRWWIWDMAAWRSGLILVFLLTAVVLDRRQRERRDWVHRLAVATVILDAAVMFAWKAWMLLADRFSGV